MPFACGFRASMSSIMTALFGRSSRPVGKWIFMMTPVSLPLVMSMIPFVLRAMAVPSRASPMRWVVSSVAGSRARMV